jgi:hypothetical protein
MVPKNKGLKPQITFSQERMTLTTNAIVYTKICKEMCKEGNKFTFVFFINFFILFKIFFS